MVKQVIENSATPAQEPVQEPIKSLEAPVVNNVQEPVKPEVKDPNMFDERGVPWKNVAYENKRRVEEVASNFNEKIRSLEDKMSRQQKERPIESWETPPAEPSVKAEDVERIAEEKANKMMAEREKCERDMNTYLNNSQQLDPYVSKYRSEIESRLSVYERRYRADPTVIQMVVNEVKGDHINDILKEREASFKPAKPVEKRLSQVNPTLLSTPSSSGKEETLTEDEKKWADVRGLREVNGGKLTDPEIKEILNKTKKK
jgi:hypothetical protein